MAFWRKYVPVAQRQAQAGKKMEKLRKKGKNIEPVEIEGRAIARSFWGKGWCDHLESFSDYSNRLPRGRTYARNGSVCHLDIQTGHIEAIVSGSSLYNITISIAPLKSTVWRRIKARCAGQVGSMLELLQGRLSDQVMTVVTDRDEGLFPKPHEIKLSCSCPDWAVMCKHVAAALYGVGNRLDTRPDLLFLLRDVDAEELIATAMALPDAAVPTADAIAEDALGDIFGIDLDTGPGADPPPEPKPARNARNRRTGASEKAAKRRTTASSAPAKPPKAPRPATQPTGKSVARLRKQLGLTVQQFAEQLGVTPSSIYRWESARGRLKLQQRCLDALGALRGQVGRKRR